MKDIQGCQTYVDSVFAKLNIKSEVIVLPFTQKLREKYRGAMAAGSYSGGVAKGHIFVDLPDLAIFSTKEIEFILAHECIHIFRDHSWSERLWKNVKVVAKGPANEFALIVEFASFAAPFVEILLSPDHLPQYAKDLVRQEFEADVEAFQLVTGDSTSADSCLLKMAGGNLDSISHYWDLHDMQIRGMTMRQRIENLRSHMPFRSAFN